MKIQSFIILALAVALFSCNDKEDEGIAIPNYLIPQELKDYVYFKPGTYWIYKDSATGIEDSVYVYYSIHGYDTLFEYDTVLHLPRGVYEGFEVYTFSSHYQYDFAYYFNTTFYHGHPETFSIHVWRGKFRPGNAEGEVFCLNYPFNIGRTSYWYDDVTTVNHFYNNYHLEGSDYLNVVKMHETFNTTESDQRTNFYFAKNFGLIRKELLDSVQTWNLIRKHIFK